MAVVAASASVLTPCVWCDPPTCGLRTFKVQESSKWSMRAATVTNVRLLGTLCLILQWACSSDGSNVHRHPCFPPLDPQASYYFTAILSATLTHPSLHRKNLGILLHDDSWLYLDFSYFPDAHDNFDALFSLVVLHLRDTKAPTA